MKVQITWEKEDIFKGLEALTLRSSHVRVIIDSMGRFFIVHLTGSGQHTLIGSFKQYEVAEWLTRNNCKPKEYV